MPANRSPSAAATDSLIGQTIGGQYTIQRFLGEGSKAQVYLATHRTLHRTVVVHLLSVPWAADPAAYAKFEEQARALRGLEHANIAGVIDFGRDDGRVFVVGEYVEGTLLSDYVQQLGRLGLEAFVPIAAQILKGLGATHARGLVHRDLKPSNVVLVEEQGRANYVKILDLGLAQILEGPPREEEPPPIGTPAYLAPEQIMNKPVDARTDVYALGALFYHMLSGRLPFEGESAAAVLYKHINDKPVPLTQVLPDDHNLPEGLIELIHDCLAKNPDNRPSDANEIVERMIDSVPAALFRLPVAGAGQGVPRPVAGQPRVGTGPQRAATPRTPTGDYRAVRTPTGDFRVPPTTPPPRADTFPQDRALAAALEASGTRPIPVVEPGPSHEPTSGGGGSSWALGLLALLLTAGLVYVYIQSQSTTPPPPPVVQEPVKAVSPGSELEPGLAKARELEAANQLKEAIAAYEVILATDPNHAQARERVAALRARLEAEAKAAAPEVPPATTAGDTKADPTGDTKADPTGDTKVDPTGDTKADPTGDTRPPEPAGPVAFSVEATPKAEVFLDGVSQGKTPLKLDIPPGTHKFELKAPGFVTHEETVDVAADGQKAIKAKLVRKTGGSTSGINRAEEDAASAQLDPDADAPSTKFELPKK